MAITKTTASITESRHQALGAMLEERRREIVREVRARIRDARSGNIHDGHVLDAGDTSEVDLQGEIEFALIQMKSEILDRIDTALQRISEGTYGVCLGCGDEIAEPRLRALPFAVRCRNCEESREQTARRALTRARRHPSSLFSEESSERLTRH